MKDTLPSFETSATFKAWRGNISQWLPVALDIAHSHGLSPVRPHVFSTGTNLVVGLDARCILKIFPPMLRAQFVSERDSLMQLRGRLTVPIPDIVFEGERDQWPYLVMTRLPGVVGAQAWPGLPEEQKERVLAHLGEIIAELQRVPAGDLLGIEPGWEAFMRGQIQGCRIRHERLGLPQKFLHGLDDLLRDAVELIPMNAPPVILTGEFIPENFLLCCQDGDWRISGLIDFGDVLTGWGEYDLLGPSAFMTAGRRGRVRRLFEGFGYSKADVDFTCKRRLMALLLLHRASDPVNHICIEGWQQKADDLFQLQELIWPD
jgi:hygromycin-B 7''-O-kinase